MSWDALQKNNGAKKDTKRKSPLVGALKFHVAGLSCEGENWVGSYGRALFDKKGSFSQYSMAILGQRTATKLKFRLLKKAKNLRSC